MVVHHFCMSDHCEFISLIVLLQVRMEFSIMKLRPDWLYWTSSLKLRRVFTLITITLMLPWRCTRVSTSGMKVMLMARTLLTTILLKLW